MTWRVGLLAGLSLMLCGEATASQQSEMLYSKGLIRFHAEQFGEALGLFEQAVEADPNDAYALYYRGVTRGRLGDRDGAIEDLRAALQQKPDLSRAELELGVALVDAHREAEAIPWLQRAQQKAELDGQASFFLGIAQLRMGENGEADVNFERAARVDPKLATAALYYRGVAAYQSERWSDAKQRFRAVTSIAPGTKLGREAAEFLTDLERGRGQPFQLYADLALRYDSNVTITGDDQTVNDNLGVSDEDDGLVAVTAGGSYAPLRTQRVLVNVGYEFFQSFYFDLTDYNLQNHRPSLEAVARFGDFRFGALGRYDYYTLDVHKFLQEATAAPWLTYLLTPSTRLDLSYRMRYRDFLDDDFEVRDAFNHSFGARHVLKLGDWSRFLAVGYRYDQEIPNGSSPEAEQFGYKGHEASAGLGWTFPAEITGELGYVFRRERYDPESQGRHDNEHHVLVGLGKDLTDWLSVHLGYLGTFNDSNQKRYQYDRHIVSASVGVRY